MSAHIICCLGDSGIHALKHHTQMSVFSHNKF